MAIKLTNEQQETGRQNFYHAVGKLGVDDAGTSRRDFMKGLVAAGMTVPVGAAAYFGYTAAELDGKPVKCALIGTGDEGGVLIGDHNPKFTEIVAVCDIRPYNQKRIFAGEKPPSPRKGLNYHYGNDCKSKIKLYEKWQDVLTDDNVEAVIIALPLHLHAPVAVAAMRAGKHVLCEKLMAWDIKSCKEMIKVANETDRVLSIGHQRHYSLLYAHAASVVDSGVLGDIKHIRALWHRNNSWPMLADGKPVPDPVTGKPMIRDGWRGPIRDEDRAALEAKIQDYGYKSMEELVRWRLFNRTGGGLMAELGSHQLDACSIFLGKVHPLAVTGVGGKFFYRDERECDDHVFVTYEFPGKSYYAPDGRVNDKDDIVVVTYSSINTNGFEPYGETVMGSRGTLVVEAERTAMMYPESGGKSAQVSVTTAAGGKPVLETTSTWGAGDRGAATVGQAALGQEANVSRGYTAEMEHFAYCVRTWAKTKDPKERPHPRCDGPHAMADAIVALTANHSMKLRRRIEFNPAWFDPMQTAVPDDLGNDKSA